MQDSEGRDIELRYFRDIDKREVDFVIVENGDPIQFVECKLSNKEASPSLRYLKIRFPSVPATQLILEPDLDLMNKDGLRVCAAHRFLNRLV